MTRDASTQTSPDKLSHKDRAKGFMKAAIQREMPKAKILQAAQKLNDSKKGVFDGTVVEEVFMEMTGVPIGPKPRMMSDWKN
jgi:hypothetical protein